MNYNQCIEWNTSTFKCTSKRNLTENISLLCEALACMKSAFSNLSTHGNLKLYIVGKGYSRLQYPNF